MTSQSNAEVFRALRPTISPEEVTRPNDGSTVVGPFVVNCGNIAQLRCRGKVLVFHADLNPSHIHDVPLSLVDVIRGSWRNILEFVEEESSCAKRLVNLLSNQMSFASGHPARLPDASHANAPFTVTPCSTDSRRCALVTATVTVQMFCNCIAQSGTLRHSVAGSDSCGALVAGKCVSPV